MGGIVDRSAEHLAPSDRMIAVTRRRLLEAATAATAPGGDGGFYDGVRGGFFLGPAGQDLAEAYETAQAAC
jgi:phthalate 4,5-dioxygenase oxygenase subunit